MTVDPPIAPADLIRCADEFRARLETLTGCEVSANYQCRDDPQIARSFTVEFCVNFLASLPEAS